MMTKVNCHSVASIRASTETDPEHAADCSWLDIECLNEGASWPSACFTIFFDQSVVPNAHLLVARIAQAINQAVTDHKTGGGK